MKNYQRDWDMRPMIPQMPAQQMPPMQMQQIPPRPNQYTQPNFQQNFIPQPSSQPVFNNSRTLQITGFPRSTTVDDLKKFFLTFGPISTLNYQSQRGQLIVMYYDSRDALAAKNESRTSKFHDSALFCDFIQDNETLCDSVLMQPKFMGKIISPDSIKNELMSYGDVCKCFRI